MILRSVLSSGGQHLTAGLLAQSASRPTTLQSVSKAALATTQVRQKGTFFYQSKELSILVKGYVARFLVHICL